MSLYDEQLNAGGFLGTSMGSPGELSVNEVNDGIRREQERGAQETLERQRSLGRGFGAGFEGLEATDTKNQRTKMKGVPSGFGQEHRRGLGALGFGLSQMFGDRNKGDR